MINKPFRWKLSLVIITHYNDYCLPCAFNARLCMRKTMSLFQTVLLLPSLVLFLICKGLSNKTQFSNCIYKVRVSKALSWNKVLKFGDNQLTISFYFFPQFLGTKLRCYFAFTNTFAFFLWMLLKKKKNTMVCNCLHTDDLTHVLHFEQNQKNAASPTRTEIQMQSFSPLYYFRQILQVYRGARKAVENEKPERLLVEIQIICSNKTF